MCKETLYGTIEKGNTIRVGKYPCLSLHMATVHVVARMPHLGFFVIENHLMVTSVCVKGRKGREGHMSGENRTNSSFHQSHTHILISPMTQKEGKQKCSTYKIEFKLLLYSIILKKLWQYCGCTSSVRKLLFCWAKLLG